MGVKGLTSYVYQNSDIYFESHQLSNCILIIDGYALASHLYNNSKRLNSAFGGDYDKYCESVTHFFDNLRKCRVNPLVICDGGYEKKKLATVKQRNLYRVFSFKKMSPSHLNHTVHLQCFPLAMRHVFREKLLELSVPIFQTDFEADSEIAALAKKLDAPVLSNDSDFFIYDVQYIPLTSMSLDSCKSDGNNFYVPCQIFKVNNLLRSLGNLPKTMLPLLGTVLGNDYLKTSKFKAFYTHLKMEKSKSLKPGQKRVKGLTKWLQGESFETALIKILQCFKKNARRHVKRDIFNCIKGYTNLNTTLEDYLPSYISIKNETSRAEELELTDSFKILCSIESSEESDNENIYEESDNENIYEESDNENIYEESDNENIYEDSDNEYINEESDNEYINDKKISYTNSNDPENNDYLTNVSDDTSPYIDESVIDNTVRSKNMAIPPWLLHESRVCNMCPSINTLLSLRIYFYSPQVEDYECSWAGSATLPILQVIAGLLGLPSIVYWHRIKNRYVSSRLLSVNSIPEFSFPDLSVLNLLSNSDKKKILFKTFKVEDNTILDGCFQDWTLFFMSIAYCAKTTEEPSFKYWHLHALIITLITVNVIGGKVGLFRNKKPFLKKYGTKLKIALEKCPSKRDSVEYENITEALEAVTLDDCLVALDCLIPYFHVDEKLCRNSRLFSRRTLHIYAQLQSTFELAVALNYLLLQPFKRCHLGNLYNGTFLYNFTVNFKNRKNILSYIDNLLGKAPSILNLYYAIYNSLITLLPTAKQIVKQKKKKNRNKIVNDRSEIVEETSDAENFNDCNNRYSILNNRSIKNN